MKKVSSYRIDPSALRAVEEVAKTLHLSRSAVVETAIFALCSRKVSQAEALAIGRVCSTFRNVKL